METIKVDTFVVGVVCSETCKTTADCSHTLCDQTSTLSCNKNGICECILNDMSTYLLSYYCIFFREALSAIIVNFCYPYKLSDMIDALIKTCFCNL
jgi:hypothetical protein